MRPSGKASEAGTIAKELTNSLPWVLMVQSYAGGLDDCCFHSRTVKSLDAETMVVGWGNARLRTLGGLDQYSLEQRGRMVYIIFVAS